MSEILPPNRKPWAPAMRALELSGDGYWEADLADGSAWFSPWFYARLGWPLAPERTYLAALKDMLPAAGWVSLLRHMRAHLERDIPLDFEMNVQLPNGQSRRWRLCGKAQRNGARHPVRLAGSMRDVTPRNPRISPRLWIPIHPNPPDSKDCS